MSSAATRAAALLALALLAGCAAPGAPAARRDPLEPVNRAVYRFNDTVDRIAFEPVARGYRDFVPEEIRVVVGNVFGNLADLWTAANQLLQGKPDAAVSDLGRFALNSTLGLAGMVDVATHFGLEKHNEDFGQTLGRWGVPPGPYLMLPLLGPSTLRDAPARVVDARGDLVQTIDSEGRRNNAILLRAIDDRAALLRAGRVIDGAALDPYAFIRDGYLQRRRSQVYDGDPPPQRDDAPRWDPEDDPEAPSAPLPAGAPSASPSAPATGSTGKP